MNEDNSSLSRGLPIPRLSNNQQQELQLHQQNQNNQQNSSYVLSTPPTNRQSTNSVSSLSHATQQSIIPPNYVTHINTISKVINVCNEIDVEDDCDATTLLVRKCIKNEIWSTNKFITDNTIKCMKIGNRTNPKSVLNILLKHTRKDNLSDIDRLKFWKKYGPLVQIEINVMKTITTRHIKEELMLGKTFCTLLFILCIMMLIKFLFRIKTGTQVLSR